MTPLSRRLYAIVAIALAAVIFAALNIAADASLTTERLDLTETGVYTLAAGTKHIIANLKEPVTLKFFFSKKTASGYAQINAYAKRVRDLLGEYAARSNGKIILEEIDPEPFTPEEDEASADGLSGAPTDSGDVVYFGLVGTNTIDGRETVPFFTEDRETYLEYDVSSLVYRLSTPKKPLLGIISTLPLDTGAGGMQAALQGQARPFVIYEELSQTYSTKMLDPNFASVPADVDVLMIVNPGPMTPQQLYAIDQFVLGGGRALVFVDPVSEIATAGQGMGGEGGGPSSSDLPSLFRAWGIAFDPTKVVADRALAQSVQVSADPRNPVAQYPVWLKLDSKEFASKDQVTASLQALNLATAGALRQAKGATTNFTPLIWSSKEASLLEVQRSRPRANPAATGSDRPLQVLNRAGQKLRPGRARFGPREDIVPVRTAARASRCRESEAGDQIGQSHQRHRHGRYRHLRRPLLGARGKPLRQAYCRTFCGQCGVRSQRGGEPHRLERSHFAAHARDQ